MVARGSKIVVYAGSNAAPLLTVNDTAFKSGGIGLASGGASVAFDNVRINPDVNPAEGSAVTVSSTYDHDGCNSQAAGARAGAEAGRRGRLPDAARRGRGVVTHQLSTCRTSSSG
ncbi:hypothetical protein AB0E69_14925 [Kribbella sp. NPDC026611]|uniref:hypothetical protein n=1 Tax=Kribbella sp. NPDC026611 TaxID=3154911 RepID=UPI0033C2E332